MNKKENESPNTLVYRFIKKVQQSGVLKETKKRRFTVREPNRNKRRSGALHRLEIRKVAEYERKMGRGPVRGARR